MASNPATPTKSSWSDTEKFQLLLQIVGQMAGPDSKISVKWDKIDIPGRTPRACSNVWAQIREQVKASGETDGAKPAKATATPKRRIKAAAKPTPTKRRKSVAAKKDEDEDSNEEIEVPPLVDEKDDDLTFPPEYYEASAFKFQDESEEEMEDEA